MTNFKKVFSGSAKWLTTAAALAFAFAFCGCVKIPDYCGEANSFNFRTESCCGGGVYDPSLYNCVGGELKVKTPTPATFTITFNANATDVTITPATGKTGVDSTLASLPTPKRNGYVFDGWFTTATGGTAVTIDTKFSASTTIYARWTEVSVTPTTYTLTTSVSPSGGGSVSLSPNKTNYTYGEQVTVTATAASGYTFTGWSGASTSTNSPVTITMNGDRTVTANFTQNPTGGVDDSYESVTIGGQKWMKKNLNIETAGSWCDDNDPVNCEKYGRLYTWSAAMGLDAIYNSTKWNGSDVNHKGICPSGWHLPSRQEWQTLVDYVGGSSSESFDDAGDHGCWWSATENNGSYAYYREVSYVDPNIFDFVDGDNKSDGFFVRCLRN